MMHFSEGHSSIGSGLDPNKDDVTLRHRRHFVDLLRKKFAYKEITGFRGMTHDGYITLTEWSGSTQGECVKQQSGSSIQSWLVHLDLIRTRGYWRSDPFRISRWQRLYKYIDTSCLLCVSSNIYFNCEWSGSTQDDCVDLGLYGFRILWYQVTDGRSDINI